MSGDPQHLRRARGSAGIQHTARLSEPRLGLGTLRLGKRKLRVKLEELQGERIIRGGIDQILAAPILDDLSFGFAHFRAQLLDLLAQPLRGALGRGVFGLYLRREILLGHRVRDARRLGRVLGHELQGDHVGPTDLLHGQSPAHGVGHLVQPLGLRVKRRLLFALSDGNQSSGM